MSILIAIFNAVRSVLSSCIRIERGLAAERLMIQEIYQRLVKIETLLRLEIADHFVFTASFDGGDTTIGVSMFTLSDSQKATLSIAVVDAKGNPATLDGPPTWATSDATIATVDASGDPTGLSAVLTGIRPGACTVTATGDSDLTADQKPINGTLDVTVIAGEAVQVTISATAPEAQ